MSRETTTRWPATLAAGPVPAMRRRRRPGTAGATAACATDTRDVSGRFAVSTAGAWSLCLPLQRRGELTGGASC